MIRMKDDEMGRFSVHVELANYDDIVQARNGHIPADKVRRLTLQGVVDTGAARLVLPENVANRLGLRRTGDVEVRYANGLKDRRSMAGDVQLTYQDRTGIFNAVLEPNRESALIGAIVLEDLDFIVDCSRQALVPRDPERIISEIE